MSGRCQEGVWKLSGRGMEGVTNGLDGVRKLLKRYLKGVWKISGRCLDGFWKVSRREQNSEQNFLDLYSL